MSKCKVCGTANFQNASKCRMCGAHLPVMDEEIDSTTNNEIFSSKNSKGANPSAERAKEIYSSHSNYNEAQQKKLFEKIRLQEEALGDVSNNDLLTNQKKMSEPKEVSNSPKKTNYQDKNKGKSKPSSSKEHTIPQRVIESNSPAGESAAHKKDQGTKSKQTNKNNNRQNSQKQSVKNQNENRNKKTDASQSQSSLEKSNSDNKQADLSNRPTNGNSPKNGSKKPQNPNQKNNRKSGNSQENRTEKNTQPVQKNDKKPENATKAPKAEFKKNPYQQKNNGNTKQRKNEEKVESAAVSTVRNSTYENSSTYLRNSQKKTKSEQTEKTAQTSQAAQTNSTVKNRTANPKRVHNNRKTQAVIQDNVSADEPKDFTSNTRSESTASSKKTAKKSLPKHSTYNTKADEKPSEPKKPSVQPVTKLPSQRTIETKSLKSATKKDIRKNKMYAAMGYMGPLVIVTLIKSSDSEYCKKHLPKCLRTLVFSIAVYMATFLGFFILHSALGEESNNLYIILSLLIALVSSVSIFVPSFNGVISALSGIAPHEK